MVRIFFVCTCVFILHLPLLQTGGDDTECPREVERTGQVGRSVECSSTLIHAISRTRDGAAEQCRVSGARASDPFSLAGRTTVLSVARRVVPGSDTAVVRFARARAEGAEQVVVRASVRTVLNSGASRRAHRS